MTQTGDAMKVVILAGGRGLRLSDVTGETPKPMILINGIPLIQHIINHYSHYGFNDFVICTGYKSEVIEDHFLNNMPDEISIKIVNSGEYSSIADRLWSIRKEINNEPFLLSYADNLSNVNINKIINSFNKSDRILTLVAVHPYIQYGVLNLKGNNLISFKEKGIDKNSWVNGGFMVADYRIFDVINKYQSKGFGYILEYLASTSNINVYKHDGFWKSIDNNKDLVYLESLLEENDKILDEFEE